jgi:hypothetical protein
MHWSKDKTRKQLTSWSQALLEKPPIVQPFKNFPAFYGTRMFITVFTRALHWSLSRARVIQYTPSHPISLSLRYILILSTHLHLGLPSGLFPSGFPTNIPYAFLFSPIVPRALPGNYVGKNLFRNFHVFFRLLRPLFLQTGIEDGPNVVFRNNHNISIQNCNFACGSAWACSAIKGGTQTEGV